MQFHYINSESRKYFFFFSTKSNLEFPFQEKVTLANITWTATGQASTCEKKYVWMVEDIVLPIGTEAYDV